MGWKQCKRIRSAVQKYASTNWRKPRRNFSQYSVSWLRFEPRTSLIRSAHSGEWDRKLTMGDCELRIWKKSVVICWKVLPRYSPEETKENPEIRTQYLVNASVYLCRCTNLLGAWPLYSIRYKFLSLATGRIQTPVSPLGILLSEHQCLPWKCSQKQ
jgi:hypothetical protein